MKNLFFSSLLLHATTATFAQTEKGRGLITGNVALSTQQISNSQNTSGTTNLTVGVARGWFVKDNWLVGVSINGRNTWVNNSNRFLNTERPFANWGVGASGFVRRYFLTERFRPYLGAGLEVSFDRNRSGWSQQTNQGTQFSRSFEDSYRVAPFLEIGALYVLTDRLALNAGARSEVLPIGFKSLNIGLNILTGGTRGNSTERLDNARQTQRGSILLGGSFGIFGNTRDNQQGTGQPADNNEVRINTFSISPSVSYFVRDGLLLGLNLPYSITTYSYRNNSRSRNTSVGFEPFVRKYIGQQRLRPFVEGNLTYRVQGSRIIDTDVKSTISAYGAGVSAGLAYLLGERFIVQANLAGLRFDRSTFEGANSHLWSLSASGTTSPTFSVNYVLR